MGGTVRDFVGVGIGGCAIVVGSREGSVVGGGGRALKEAVRRRWSLVVSEIICLGMRQGKGTMEEKVMTMS